MFDNVSGSERDDEDWEHVDQIRRSVRCYNCGMMEHTHCQGLSRERQRQGQRERWRKKGAPRAKKGKAGNGKKDGGKFGGYKGGAPGEFKGGRIAHKSSESRWGIDGIDEEDADFAERVEVNLSQKKTKESEACGSLGMWRNSGKRRRLPRFLHFHATDSVKFVKSSETGPGKKSRRTARRVQ